MNVSEFIGFLITIIAMAAIFFRRAQESKRRRENPEAYDQEVEEKEQKLREFLQSLNGNTLQGRVKPPPPPPAPKHAPVREAEPPSLLKGYEFEPGLEHYEKTSGVEGRKFQSPIEEVSLPAFHVDIGTDELTSEAAEEAYRVEEKKRHSRLEKMIEDPRKLLIFRELISKPPGLRANPLDHDTLF